PPRPPPFPYTTLFRSSTNTERARLGKGGGAKSEVRETRRLAPSRSPGIASITNRTTVDRMSDGSSSTAIAGAVDRRRGRARFARSEEHTSELQSRENL